MTPRTRAARTLTFEAGAPAAADANHVWSDGALTFEAGAPTVADADHVCSLPPSYCAEFEFPIDVTGGSPRGSLHFTSVSLTYTSSLGMHTSLTFRGTHDGRELTMIISHLEAGAAWPPGTYEATAERLYARGDTMISLTPCAQNTERGPRAQVVIEEHERPENLERGSSIRLKGRLDVVEPGWSLTVPFEATALCDYIVHPF